MGRKIAALEKLSDEDLMAEYQLGNSEAFDLLYARHKDKIYGYLSKKMTTQSQIDDAFQECFMRAHRFRSRYDRSFPFLPWLFTICRNAMIDQLRKNRPTEELPENHPAASAALPFDGTLADSLDELPKKDAQVLTLHYLHGYSFDEVASYLKIKPAGARKISSRAIQKLRTIFRKQYD
ncbi:MAG: sigma-70 family RNA polymerase sigma factor [Oligoflexia bacterium]|nr:sigma-70 family RNA polymerase sigma factor [Oligoflexia bacterium]